MAGLASLPGSQYRWACKVARIAACKVVRIAILLGLQRCQDRDIAGLASLPGSQYCWACKGTKIAVLLGLKGCRDRDIAPLTLSQAGESSCAAETSNEHVDASNGHTDEHVDLAISYTMKEDILARSHGQNHRKTQRFVVTPRSFSSRYIKSSRPGEVGGRGGSL